MRSRNLFLDSQVRMLTGFSACVRASGVLCGPTQACHSSHSAVISYTLKPMSLGWPHRRDVAWPYP